MHRETTSVVTTLVTVLAVGLATSFSKTTSLKIFAHRLPKNARDALEIGSRRSTRALPNLLSMDPLGAMWQAFA